MPIRNAALAAVLVLASLPGCRPSFERDVGALFIAGEPFIPTTCHVLTTCTGLELIDAAGVRVELTLPPARLDAWRSIGGPATVRLRLGPGEAEKELGRCGSATLIGQGYHGEGRRAASGKVSLACPGPPAAQGELAFTGCF